MVEARAITLQRLLERWLDPSLEHGMRSFVGTRVHDPMVTALAPERRAAMLTVRAAFARRARRLSGPPSAGASHDSFDALASAAIEAMRAEPHRGERASHDRSAPKRLVTAALRALDRHLLHQAPELMDDPAFPERERRLALETLDRFNERVGSYATFLRLLEPLLVAARRRGRPIVVHDVAAGHGGFAIYLKRSLGDRVVVQASDIAPEYLEHGRRRASELAVDVSFERRDAHDLGDLGRRGVDIVTCTQSLHHFAPGAVARLMAEATRSARVGACFIDGARSWLVFVLLSIAATLYGRRYAFVHDASLSIRRMYQEEELALLAALAPNMPRDARIETGVSPPAHTFVRIRRAARSPKIGPDRAKPCSRAA